MKVIFKSYVYRLEPTKNDKILLDKHFGCVRYVYNYFLNERQEQYKEFKKSYTYNIQAADLVKLKKKENTIWLKEVNAQSLQYAVKCVDIAYNNFFKGFTKYPKFKCKNDKNSFHIPQSTKIKNHKLYIFKFKRGIKIIIDRELKGKICNSTISKTSTGKYYVSILTEQNIQPLEKTNQSIGIDLGLNDLAITSEGIKYKNHRYTQKYKKKLKKAQQHLSRKKKGSNSYENQRRKVALIHEKIENSRKDNLHKISTQLIKDYDIIAIESLNVKGLIKNRKLSKSISDASWGTFIQFLMYKADWNNKQIVKIDRWFPSSKTCSICETIKQDLKLSDREWTCENGHFHDRDINAAKNILKEGLKILKSAGTVDYTGGVINKTSVKKHKTVKPETLIIE